MCIFGKRKEEEKKKKEKWGENWKKVKGRERK